MPLVCDARLEIRLPALLRAQLDAQAAAKGWSAAAYVREAIRERVIEETRPSGRQGRAR